MKHGLSAALGAVSFAAWLAAPISAAIPQAISFEGILVNAAGQPKPAGTYNITFRLYDVASGGSPLWTEAAKPVTLTGSHGLFTTQLGVPTPFGSLAFDKPYFVEVQIAGEASAMAPRYSLASVPYALNTPSATLSLPLSGTASVASPDNAMYVRNSGTGAAIEGSSDNNSGILGLSINYDAVAGYSTTGNGIRGGSTSNKGVFGTSTDGVGTQGSSTNGIGLYGSSSKSYGVYGISTSSAGVYGESASYEAVNGVGHAGGLPAIYGQNDNSAGDGVWGSGAHVGVWGDSGAGTGVYGLSEQGAYGVIGESTQGYAGVWGHGVHNGVFGQTSSSADSGVFGRNEMSGTGVTGYNALTQSWGWLGTVISPGPPNSLTPYGVGVSGAGQYGVYGYGHDGPGTNGHNYGVFGYNDASADTSGIPGNSAVGVSGVSVNGDGVYGFSTNGPAVAGVSGQGGSFGFLGGYLVAPSGSKTGVGVAGQGVNGGLAGRFEGEVQINGTLNALTKNFRIDHPLDPANKYLYHTSVESPDMKNLYDGIAVLDAGGQADVHLPGYFEALNMDFRYQLTAIGAPAPNLFIASRVQGNTFRIAGGIPGMEVSWQVTGIRKDAWAQGHRTVPEVDKPAGDRGRYLTPEAYGRPTSAAIDSLPGR
ncbi:MAG TPA: hypothetical protein VGM51_06710 [Armatimonadota bacterium]